MLPGNWRSVENQTRILKIWSKEKKHQYNPDGPTKKTGYTIHTSQGQYGILINLNIMGARRPSGRASDSESRGPGFDPHKGHRVVSMSKTHLLHRVLVKTQEAMAPSNMTEKLLTGTLNLNKI